jgi:hypothetical protein
MYTSKEEEIFPDKPSSKELEGIRGTFVLSGLALLTPFLILDHISNVL